MTRAPRKSPMPLDWGALQFFAVVAETGAIASAAKRLGVNHSTVLRRIAGLERELGCRLFDRLPGGYALTTSGNSLAEHLAGLGERVESTQRQLAGLDPSIEGSIRIASSDMLAEGLLMPLLAEFRRRHPGVRMQLVLGHQFTALSRREADIALRAADKAPGQLIARQAGRIQTVLCASKEYLDRSGADRPLAEHRWVTVDEALSSPRVEAWLRRHHGRERVVMRIDSLVGVADAVAAGLGLGLLPLPLVRARPQLVQLAPPDPALDQPIWVLMHPDVERTARVRHLFEFLAGALAACPRPDRS